MLFYYLNTVYPIYLLIMSGCNNHCAFCIVPRTRGIERSRPIESIIEESKYLRDQGIKDITLLGQNVNSFRDTSTSTSFPHTSRETQLSNSGFRTVYRPKSDGRRFIDLLDSLSNAVPECRIRFTSPHPKDFPLDLLQLIAERGNICHHLHIPAQSGNSAVLDRMRRGYTREAYLLLVDQIRSVIPNASLSSDFIGILKTTLLPKLFTYSWVLWRNRRRTPGHRVAHGTSEIRSSLPLQV
jgi:tRNA A37 methylthiotransferase MiaB